MNVRQTLLQTAEFLGLNRRARHRTRRRLLGLCYHGVVAQAGPSDDARTRIAVTVSQFEAQMRELRRHWTPVSSEQIVKAIAGEAPLPDRAVHVSFDDGYRNNLTVAAPVLARYEIPATVFVTSGFLDTKKPLWPLEAHERLTVWPRPRVRYSPDEPPFSIFIRKFAPPDSPERSEQVLAFVDAAKTLTPPQREKFLAVLRTETMLDVSPSWKRELYDALDWSDLPELSRHGIEIGAHTVTHPNLTRLSKAEQRYEIETSREKIERALGPGSRCVSFAYPFGSSRDYSDEVVETVRELKFRLAFTLEERRNTETLDPFHIHRICIHRELTHPSFLSLISGLRNT